MDAYPGIGMGVAATGTNNYNLHINVDKAKYANNLEYAFYEGNTQLQGALIEQSGTISYPVSYTDANKSLDLRLRYYSETPVRADFFA